MWSTAILLTSMAGAEPHPLDCGVPDRPPPRWSGFVPSAPPPPSDKAVRNAYGDALSVYETTNFAVWWGPNGSLSEGHASALADAFEDSWAEQIDVQGYPRPREADTYKFNVYIGDTGGGAPSAEGAAGYFYQDPAGYPMVVIDRDLAQNPASARLTAAHEFFHAVQEATGSYGFGETAMWWHEATANWMVDQVYPDFAGNVSTLYAIYTRPEFPLNYFTWSWSAQPEDDHAYAAQLFVSYLEENHGGSDFVYDTWNDVDESDPIVVIDGLLRSLDIGEAHHEYALKNATWDYVHGDTLAWWASDAEAQFPDDSHRVAGTLSLANTGIWVESGAFPPQTYGANYWALDGDLPETLTVTLETGEAAAWWLGAAMVEAGEHRQEWGTSDGEGAIHLFLDELAEADAAWLVVSAVEGSENTGESFPYRIRVDAGDQRPTNEADATSAGGCSCSSADSRPAHLGWLLTGVLLWGTLRGRMKEGTRDSGGGSRHSIVSLLCGVWFLLTGWIWTYLISLWFAYPIGILGFVYWRKAERSAPGTAMNRTAIGVLGVGLVVSIAAFLNYYFYE